MKILLMALVVAGMVGTVIPTQAAMAEYPSPRSSQATPQVEGEASVGNGEERKIGVSQDNEVGESYCYDNSLITSGPAKGLCRDG